MYQHHEISKHLRQVAHRRQEVLQACEGAVVRGAAVAVIRRSEAHRRHAEGCMIVWRRTAWHLHVSACAGVDWSGEELHAAFVEDWYALLTWNAVSQS